MSNICGWRLLKPSLISSDLWMASQSMCSFPLSEKSPEIKQNLQTSLENCFRNLPPYPPWLKCLPCNRTGVIFIQTPRLPRHPGHLYRHRRHGLSRCFPTAEDGCLAALTSSMWVKMFDPVTPNESIENA